MNVQRIEVVGRTVVKPELLQSKNKKPYAKVRIAVNKKKDIGKKKQSEKTTYYDLLVFGKRAEKSQNLEKGMLLRSMGDIDITPYLTKKGEPKASQTIFVKEFQVLSTDIFK